MKRTAILVYGIIAYLAFFITILYAIGFLTGFVVPKDINGGVETALSSAILINVILLSLFAIQHTIMARPAFKQWWTRVIPEPAERSTFVLAASLLLLLLFWQWRPLPAPVWEVENVAGRTILTAIALLGWGIVFYSSFLIDHFDLFGLRQSWLYFKGKPYTHHPFTARSLYKYLRHPLMLGFLLAFWSTPEMTQGHLLFAVVTTGYIFFGIYIEERDLLAHLGEDYATYRETTSMIVPMPPKKVPIGPSSGGRI